MPITDPQFQQIVIEKFQHVLLAVFLAVFSFMVWASVETIRREWKEQTEPLRREKGFSVPNLLLMLVSLTIGSVGLFVYEMSRTLGSPLLDLADSIDSKIDARVEAVKQKYS